MAPRASRLALGALGGLLVMLVVVAGCGGEPDQESSTTEPSTTEPSTTESATTDASPDLDRYLLEAGEVPGLRPVSAPLTDSGEPFDLTSDGAERLRRSGYVSTTFQPAQGHHGAGVSSVLLFHTEAGARDWMAYETKLEVIQQQSSEGRIRRFQVSGVPGAHGWTGLDLHGNAIGHVYWTQGRCMMLIGLEVEGPRVQRLAQGVRAIYERTGGTCPE